MGDYKLSQRTENDLSKIYEYGIEAFGLKQAKEYLIGIHDLFHILATNNHLGRDASEFMLSLKRFSYKSHTIFYVTTTNGILIVRVLNQRLDYENNM